MIRRLHEVPALFAGWPAHFEWYELTLPDSDQAVAVAGLDWASIPGGVGLHLEIVPGKWGRAALRACREALPWLEAEARRRGVSCIVGAKTNPADARRWFRFTELFGFTDQTSMILAFRRLDGPDRALPSPGEGGHARG
jgi:hypothetical protein